MCIQHYLYLWKLDIQDSGRYVLYAYEVHYGYDHLSLFTIILLWKYVQNVFLYLYMRVMHACIRVISYMRAIL